MKSKKKEIEKDGGCDNCEVEEHCEIDDDFYGHMAINKAKTGHKKTKHMRSF